MARKPGLPSRWLAFVSVLAFVCPAAFAQGRGEADIAAQGYYLGGSSDSLQSTSGMALRFRTFLTGLGILSGSVEGYGSQNRFETGENYLQLLGTPWMGRRWNLTAGDFRAPGSLLRLPADNIFLPEITARGVQIEASRDDVRYSFFAGQQTLSAGPRVAYRITGPQMVMGASAVRRFGSRLEIGARFLQLSATPAAMEENLFLFPRGQGLRMARSLSVQSIYSPRAGWKFWGEVSRPFASSERDVTSSAAGISREGGRLTFRANYLRQGAQYLPLAGYFTGDRRGPMAEARYQVRKWFEIFSMGSATRNNLERDASVTVFSTSTRSAGLSATLPGNLGATAQITSVRFSSQAPGAATVASRNRQISAGLSRAVSRHLLRLNWRDLKLAMAGATQRQRTAELEDMYHLGPLFAGGSVRLQSAAGADRRNSVFFRGRAQGNLGRFSAFANVELGNDLANRTIFAVSAYSTTALGLAARISRDWNLQMEAFRNRLNMDLNPESAFVLAAGGAPIGRNLMDLNQWSLYFRLTRQIRWGGGLPQENLNQFTARNVPLTGVIEGYVRVLAGSTRLPAAGIPVMLDGYRTVSTGDDGRFRFEETPEGTHEVALSSRELPADYDPGALRNARVVVQPRRTARAELEVLPLLPLEGKIRGPEGVPLDGIIVRLLPGERYTNASADGVFVFYNLREGDYEVAIDPKSLPEGGELLSPRSVPAAVRTGAPVAPVHFSIGVNPQQKPIRKVLEIK